MTSVHFGNVLAVYMKDVKSEDMEALLDFMYRGVVHIPQESLTGLLKTAEGLQVCRYLIYFEILFFRECGDWYSQWLFV